MQVQNAEHVAILADKMTTLRTHSYPNSYRPNTSLTEKAKRHVLWNV